MSRKEHPCTAFAGDKETCLTADAKCMFVELEGENRSILKAYCTIRLSEHFVYHSYFRHNCNLKSILLKFDEINVDFQKSFVYGLVSSFRSLP